MTKYKCSSHCDWTRIFADGPHKENCDAINSIFYNIFIKDAKMNFIKPLFITPHNVAKEKNIFFIFL